MEQDLAALRARLDAIDLGIVDALAERLRVVAEVARLKEEASDALVRDPAREEALVARVVEHGRALGLDGFFVSRIFRELLDHSLRLQHAHLTRARSGEPGAGPAIVVAYQGGLGSYSHLAATRHFGAHRGEVLYEGADSFRAILSAVAAGHADYAVLPIENTTAGSINESYDLLARMDLALVGEEVQHVDHCLVGAAPVPVASIRRVLSHPQALAQCGEFLATLGRCTIEAFTDTALAVAKVKADADPTVAAVASEEAARLYGLPVLARHLANQAENYTRMVIVARAPAAYDVRIPCKTSLILATRHEHGALASCLNVLHEHGLNLTKLESRPRPGEPWEYLFYVDFEGNVADPAIAAALQELAGRTSFLKVLGSYPIRTAKD